MITRIDYSIDCMNEKEICIDLVFVEKKERGKGIATKMIKEVISYARENGFESVGLYAESQDIETDTDRLVDWYRSLGFESDGDCDQLMTYYI